MTQQAPIKRYPPLDAWRFDAMTKGQEKLWGLGKIADFLGVSESTARRWANCDDVPIYKPVGQNTYFALRSELDAWLRSK